MSRVDFRREARTAYLMIIVVESIMLAESLMCEPLDCKDECGLVVVVAGTQEAVCLDRLSCE